MKWRAVLPRTLEEAFLQGLEETLRARGLLPQPGRPSPTLAGGYSAAGEPEQEYDYFDDLLFILNRREAVQRCIDQTLQPTFQEQLFQAIDERGLTDVAVYRRAQIDRRLFAKIRADSQYHPSKKTAVALALALRLDRAAAQKLLQSAGHALSESLVADVIVLYCIDHGVYDVLQVNEALAYFDQELL